MFTEGWGIVSLKINRAWFNKAQEATCACLLVSRHTLLYTVRCQDYNLQFKFENKANCLAPTRPIYLKFSTIESKENVISVISFPLFSQCHESRAVHELGKPIWHRWFVSDIRVRGVHHLRYAAMNRKFARTTTVPGDLRTPGLWNGLPLLSVWTQAIVEPRPFCPIILDFATKCENPFNTAVKFSCKGRLFKNKCQYCHFLKVTR